MHVRMLVVAAAASLLLSSGALAQTSTADAGVTAAPAEKKPAKVKKKKSKTSSKKKKKAKKGTAQPAPLPPAPAQPEIDEETRKALEGAAAPPAVAGPVDDEPPVLNHTPITKATKGKPVTITATATDPSGVFGPILYLRKKGMGVNDYVPIKMTASKIVPGDYSAEIPAALVNVDALEYYIA